MLSSKRAVVDSDRLSTLPDEILWHILSFLSTATSVKTSILSRRWRFLWAYVPNLIFDWSDHDDVIYRVMLLRKAKSINTLCITRNAARSELQVDTWITFAITRNVRNLHLFVDHDSFLPMCLFTCKTLVDLRLDCCGVIPTCRAVCLPRLKKLHLIHVGYEEDESLARLLSGCPVLEELVLKLSDDLKTCNISSPTLERLTVHFHLCDSEYHECRFLINTPALGYFRIIDCFGDISYFTSLIEADIYLHKDNKKQYDFVYSRSVPKSIDWLGILDIKSLRLDLSSYRSENVDSEFSIGTMRFHSLTKLELIADCCFVSKFLENADNLEILIFSELSEEEKGWIEPKRVPTCLLSHLKVIKLANVVDERNNFEIVRYLLKNGAVLEKMEIEYPSSFDSAEMSRMIQEIPLFERASKACEITFVEIVEDNCNL